jgi:hypothetical protein
MGTGQQDSQETMPGKCIFRENVFENEYFINVFAKNFRFSQKGLRKRKFRYPFRENFRNTNIVEKILDFRINFHEISLIFGVSAKIQKPIFVSTLFLVSRCMEYISSE